MLKRDQREDVAIGGKQGMKDLAETFLYCFTMELNRVSQGGRNANILAQVFERFDLLAGRRKPFFMFSPQELNEMSGQLFGDISDETFTDFVLSLTISLQSHLIRDGQDIMDLCRDLSDSLVILEENSSDSVNATADTFSERFSDKDTILKTLKANRWMLTVLLGSMFTPHINDAFSDDSNVSKKK